MRERGCREIGRHGVLRVAHGLQLDEEPAEQAARGLARVRLDLNLARLRAAITKFTPAGLHSRAVAPSRPIRPSGQAGTATPMHSHAGSCRTRPPGRPTSGLDAFVATAMASSRRPTRSSTVVSSRRPEELVELADFLGQRPRRVQQLDTRFRVPAPGARDPERADAWASPRARPARRPAPRRSPRGTAARRRGTSLRASGPGPVRRGRAPARGRARRGRVRLPGGGRRGRPPGRRRHGGTGRAARGGAPSATVRSARQAGRSPLPECRSAARAAGGEGGIPGPCERGLSGVWGSRPTRAARPVGELQGR